MSLKHCTTNFKAVAPFLAAANASGGYLRIENDPYMPLVVENLEYTDRKGRPIYSLTHYGEQNGDAMRDPDMTFAVDYEHGEVIPMTYQNDYMGVYQEVYTLEGGRLMQRTGLLRDLDAFLWQWLKNIKAQGFKPIPRTEDEN